VAQSPTHPITVYASHPPLPTTTQHSLPGGALPPYRGRSFTGRIAPASPDAPEPRVRIHLPPAESQQAFGSCSRAPPAPRRIELTTARDAGRREDPLRRAISTCQSRPRVSLSPPGAGFELFVPLGIGASPSRAEPCSETNGSANSPSHRPNEMAKVHKSSGWLSLSGTMHRD
jgi:hypothetical protein